jgi:hypothetical protein
VTDGPAPVSPSHRGRLVRSYSVAWVRADVFVAEEGSTNDSTHFVGKFIAAAALIVDIRGLGAAVVLRQELGMREQSPSRESAIAYLAAQHRVVRRHEPRAILGNASAAPAAAVAGSSLWLFLAGGLHALRASRPLRAVTEMRAEPRIVLVDKGVPVAHRNNASAWGSSIVLPSSL